MRRITFTAAMPLVAITCMASGAWPLAASQVAPPKAHTLNDGNGSASGAIHLQVDCKRRETLSRALATPAEGALDIRFTGTCTEAVIITRPAVTLRGADASATLVGTIDIRGVSGVHLTNFLIQGVPGAPVNTAEAGINILEGASVTVENMQLEEMQTRGLQVIGGTATIRNVSISKAHVGAFVFRAASLFFDGQLSATDSLFGMSLLYSGATAKAVDLSFINNTFGLIIQVNSSLEHVSGHLTVHGGALGVFLAGQGVLAYGSTFDVRNTTVTGVTIDELSSMTPLVGAIGGGPALTVMNNPIAFSLDRMSTLELVSPATVSGNGVGIQNANSLFRATDAVVSGNSSADVQLSFGAKAQLAGANLVVGSPVQCDDSVLISGSACGATLARLQDGTVSRAGQRLRLAAETAARHDAALPDLRHLQGLP